MIELRIEDKPAFRVAGRRTWISGQDNEQFGRFWAESMQNGLIDELNRLTENQPGAVTEAHVFGVSRVEEDPNDRAFYFYIAAETPESDTPAGLDQFDVPAAKWAIFSNRGELPMSLIEAEMYAFMEWLPSSGYRHANAPELEVYPSRDSAFVEFWLPICKN